MVYIIYTLLKGKAIHQFTLMILLRMEGNVQHTSAESRVDATPPWRGVDGALQLSSSQVVEFFLDSTSTGQ